MRKLLYALLIISLSFLSCEEDDNEKEKLTIVKGTVSDSLTGELIEAYKLLINVQPPTIMHSSSSYILESVVTDSQGEFNYQFIAKEARTYIIGSGINLSYDIIKNTNVNIEPEETNLYDFKVDRIEN